MTAIVHLGFDKEEWRPGVMTRMRISAGTGATALCIFEQWCAPQTGAPLHWHDVEEVLSVVSGRMEVTLEGSRAELGPDESVLVPPRAVHGFRNVGEGELHLHAILASPYFEAWPVGESTSIVRWR